MTPPVHHMTVIRYYRDRQGWDAEDTLQPPWESVESAIRRMENYCFPIVQLNLTPYEDDMTIFNVVGGDGRCAGQPGQLPQQLEDPRCVWDPVWRRPEQRAILC